MDSNIFNPKIPYIGPLPGQLQPGNLIRIAGTINSSATCFSINLQNGANTYQRSDIALHLSPVFSAPPRLVRNSLENQQWGPEESHGPYFPLVTGQSFEILILVEADEFKIAINGQHFTEFQYRLPLQSISHITVDGEVVINYIKFEGFVKSPHMASNSGDSISKPLGFVIDPSNQGSNMNPPVGGRPPSPYGSSALPYPPNPSFGSSPAPYAPPSSGYPQNTLSPSNPYPSYNPYSQPSGRVSPNPYATSGRVSPNPYGPPPGTYPQGYPQQQGSYPSHGYPSSNQYPSQPGPYPGTSVVYPGQEKKTQGSGGGMNLGPLAAAGAAALAGVAGSSLLGGKHKKKKHGHGIPGMLGHGAGPAALIGGMSSLLGGNKHGHKGSSPIPIGGAMAAGATGLAGAYMMGKVLKPKKMKKLYKHKHKGWGSSSSSSSD